MKREFDEDDNENQDFDRRKMIVTILPFVLIILILGITLLVNSLKGTDKGTDQDLQQEIMDYADEHAEEGAQEGNSGTGMGQAQAVINPQPEPQTEAEQENEPEPLETPAAEAAPTPYREVMETANIDYSKVKFDKDRQLNEMMAYWEENNQKALDDLANLDRFIAMSYTLRGTKNFYYAGEVDDSGRPNGKGIAVYADNQYYYGDWKEGLRSGKGTWMHYHIHQTKNTTDLYTYHQYAGGWEKDLPQGEGSEHYEYNTALLKKGVGYDTNLIGSYSAGLVNGKFYLTNIYSDGKMKEWNAEADQGSWVYLSDTKDKKGNRTVYVDTHDPDNYIWLHPSQNKNIGVRCLISKMKN